MPKDKLDFKPLLTRFHKETPKLPRKLGENAVKFFQGNFKREGFLDRSVTKWKKRKNDKSRGKTKILTGYPGGGSLRRSIKVVRSNSKKAVVGTIGVQYAQIHNEGGVTHPTVTPKMRGWARHQYKKTGNPKFLGIANTKKEKLTVPIPKRQFIGKSFYLEKQILRRIDAEIRKFAKTLK